MTGESATLVLAVGGTAPGTEHDQIQITGTATLDGTLDVTLTGGFEPLVGDGFEMMRIMRGLSEDAFSNTPVTKRGR